MKAAFSIRAHAPRAARASIACMVAILLTLPILIGQASAEERPVAEEQKHHMKNAGQPHHADRPRRPATLTVTGIGTINAEPDIALISTAVVTEAKTPSEALTENSGKMNAIFATLEKAGIERKNIQTSNFSLQPRYSYYQPKPDEEQRPPAIVGYTVSNAVSIKVLDLRKTGDILTAVVADGSNELGGISFDIADRNALLDQARKEAVLDARRKADIYLSAANARVGRIIDFAEGSVARPMRFKQAALRAEASADAVPIAGGEEEVSVNVTITYAIEQ
ncbi:MAG: SIMPL domain-containing protein [Rhizobiales bacterium]|nr:SIMPL domain-containing protein [Hyphomicrobiales bacterium]